MFNCNQRKWSEKKPLELFSSSNNTVQTLGPLKTSVIFDDWQIPRAKITVVADGFQPILRRNLFDQLGKTITQKSCPKFEINIIELPCTIKQPKVKEFPELITRIDKSKHHTVNSNFHKNY